jgi:hypothetical protein
LVNWGTYCCGYSLFEGKGIVAISRIFAESQMAGELSDRPAMRNALISKSAEGPRKVLKQHLIQTLKALTAHWEEKENSKSQESWWLPVDPESGREIRRSKGRTQAVTTVAFRSVELTAAEHAPAR